MIKNPKLKHFGKRKGDDKPGFYKESALFPNTHPATPGSKYAKAVELPDPDLEPLEPEDGDKAPLPSETAKAIDMLRDMTKAVTPEKPDMTGKLEGKFSVSVKEMIDWLNKIISAEYSEWMRWYHYALVLKGHARGGISKEFEAHAEDELGHIDTIALRVVALGGYPTTEMTHPKPLTSREDILNELIYHEQEGVKLYRQVLDLCGDNVGTRVVIEANLEKEQEHLDELWRWLQGEGKVSKANTSSGKDTRKPEQQGIDAYNHGFSRDIEGESGGVTPDLPERGKDWHGTVPGVPDEPEAATEEDEKKQKEAQKYFKRPLDPLAPPKIAKPAPSPQIEEAQKALAGAPRFAEAPVVPPRAVDFLLEHGFTPAEIDAGEANMTSRMRALYNRNLLSSVRKSISALKTRG